jgi:hypothetical protein
MGARRRIEDRVSNFFPTCPNFEEEIPFNGVRFVTPYFSEK